MRVAMDNHKKKRKRRKQEGIGGNGAFFACCGALAGLLSMIKRIPLTNIIGDNGNAYFSMAFDTYTFFFLFCGYAADPHAELVLRDALRYSLIVNLNS